MSATAPFEAAMEVMRHEVNLCWKSATGAAHRVAPVMSATRVPTLSEVLWEGCARALSTNYPT